MDNVIFMLGLACVFAAVFAWFGIVALLLCFGIFLIFWAVASAVVKNAKAEKDRGLK